MQSHVLFPLKSSPLQRTLVPTLNLSTLIGLLFGTFKSIYIYIYTHMHIIDKILYKLKKLSCHGPPSGS